MYHVLSTELAFALEIHLNDVPEIPMNRCPIEIKNA